MKNNKGFTLIELLVCLALVTAITTTITVGVRALLGKQQEKEHNTYIKTVEDAACTYASVNNLRDKCVNKNNCELTIKKEDIIKAGLLDENLTSPIKEYIPSNNITVTWNTEGNKVCTYTEVKEGE